MTRARTFGVALVTLLVVLGSLPPAVVGVVVSGDATGQAAVQQADDPPTAVAVIPNETAELNETFQLDASGSTDDTGIVEYRWDTTGDGTIDRISNESVIWTYHDDPDKVGEVEVTLWVEDESGQTDTDTATITIVDPEDGNETTPGDGNETEPGDGNETTPGDGNETTPGDGNETAPDDGEDPADEPDDSSDEEDSDDSGADVGETLVNVDREGPRTVVATVDAWGNEPIAVPLESSGSGSVVVFDAATVHLAQGNQFTLRAEVSADAAAANVSGFDALGAVTLEPGELEDWARNRTEVTFTVSGEDLAAMNATPAAVQVYHLAGNDSTAVNTTLVGGPFGTNGSALANVTTPQNGSYEYRASTTRFGTFAVGIGHPAFTVTRLSLSETDLRVGDTVEVNAVVENAGLANGSYEATLALDGETIRNRTVDVTAGSNETVEFVHRVSESGEHTLTLGDAEAGFTAEATDGGEDDSDESAGDSDDATSDDETTAEDDGMSDDGMSDDETTTEDDGMTDDDGTTEDGSGKNPAVSGGQPGFGVAAALVALLAAGLLVARRRS